MLRATLVLGLLAAVAIASACNDASSGLAGVSCSQTSNCQSGLECLADSLPQGGGCVGLGMECLQPCTTTAECVASLGSGYTCSNGPCGATPTATCQPIIELDGGPDGETPVTLDATAASDGDATATLDATQVSDGAHE